MGYTIEKDIIPGLNQGNLSAANLVIAHESGNPNNTGANSLETEINFMKNNHANAFVSHWVGGGGRIVQLAAAGKVQWGAGPKANPYSYAHVELSRTSNAATFKKDYAAYVWLLRDLAGDAGIPKTLDAGSTVGNKGIKSHNWVSRNLGGTDHTDPFAYLNSFGISQAQFKKDVEAGTANIKPTAPSKPAPKPQPGNLGLVDYMVSKNMDAGYSNREKLAKQYGISGYKGSAGQNKTLLSKIKGGKPSSGGSSTSGGVKSKKAKLRFYNKPSWDDADVAGHLSKGIGFPTIVKKIKVGNSHQYQVKNSKGATYYVTANPSFVSTSGKSSGGGKSIATMAKEVIDGKHGNGNAARQKSLGISKAKYEKVRKEVNKRL